MEKYYIAYASDNNYAMQLGVSLYSLFENNRDLKLVVYVFDDEISNENKMRISKIADKFSQELIIKKMPDFSDITGEIFYVGSWSMPAYCRLFFTKLLPTTIDKILWLDCDTVISGNIFELLSEDIDNYAAAGVLDCIWDSNLKFLNGFKRYENYYNSGVLLINLSFWRENKIDEQMVEEIKRRKGKSIDVDQSYINCILKNKIKTISPKYNFMTPFYMAIEDNASYLKICDFKKFEIYQDKELEEALNDVRIYHLLNCVYFRPWFSNASHPYTDRWREYLKKTDWRNYDFKPFIVRVNKFKCFLKKMGLFHFFKAMKLLLIKNTFIRNLYVRVKYGFWQK